VWIRSAQLIANLLKSGPNEPDQELDRLAHQVIGAAIEVHRQLGPGLLEGVYENAICIEFELRNIPFRTQSRGALLTRGDQSEKQVGSLSRGAPHSRAKSYGEAGADSLSSDDFLPEGDKSRAWFIDHFNVPVLKEGIRREVLS
jgi:hypothetical protein